MSGSQLHNAYAQAIIQLGKSANIDAPKELTTFNEVINSSNEFESLLFLNIFTAEEKRSVLTEIFNKINLSDLIKNFIYLLIDEKRIGELPSIFKEVIVIDDHARGFLKGSIESSDGKIDDKIKNQLIAVMKKKLNAEIELDVKINKKITAGYKVTVGDLQIDATVDNQLEQLKRQILAD